MPEKIFPCLFGTSFWRNGPSGKTQQTGHIPAFVCLAALTLGFRLEPPVLPPPSFQRPAQVAMLLSELQEYTIPYLIS
jgi:hypothetical protein